MAADLQRAWPPGQALDLRRPPDERGSFGPLIGRSTALRKVYALIERVAPTEARVFLTGESGTGKELVAETIHRLSRRRSGNFVAVNCGALAPSLIESELFGHEKGSFTGADRQRVGYFERANGGTLFLDEVTEMPQLLQVKLLRAIESGSITRVGATEPTPVDVRIVAATNRSATDAAAKDRLREDLLHRLNVFPIELPPLRMRDDDAVLLAEHFLERVNARDGTRKRFSACALVRLKLLAWPGNVRELENAVERAAILADEIIDAKTLPPPGSRELIARDAVLRVPVGTSLEVIERSVILATFECLGGDKRRTADVLGISLKTLYSRLSVYQAQGSADARSAPGGAPEIEIPRCDRTAPDEATPHRGPTDRC